MKLRLLFVLIITFTILFGCNKAIKEYYINFEIPYEQIVDVPNGGYAIGGMLPVGGVSISYPAYAVVTGIDTMLHKYNAKADRVATITLLLSSINIVMPAGLNFNYLDSFQLYISARNLAEQLIAYHYSVPKNVKMFDLQKVPDLNLKDYLLNDTIYFRINTRINTPTPPDEKIRLQTLFHIEANPII